MSDHVHIEGEELLQILLEPASTRRAEIDACASCSQSARELGSAVERLRGLLEDGAARSDGASAHLAELVLARTTRNDPSWRGGLRRAASSARERWRASAAFRTAAACLLITFAAVPVVAWFAFDSGPGPREADTDRGAPRPAGELGKPQVVDTARTDAELAAHAAAEQARELEARNLRAAKVPLASALAQPAGGPALLLWARSKQIESGSLDGIVITVADSFEPLQVALSIEVLLDSWALTGRRPAALGEALAEFSAWSERIHDEVALRAWERAERYGAVDPFDQPQLAAVRRALRGDERAIAPGAGTPLDSAWFDALSAALAERPRDGGGVIAAWLAARH
jgi:hypothetical protein